MSFNFDGSAVRSKRVAMGGKSRAEESREQVLERTRLERERRKQAKLENKSATVIQAAWQAWHGSRQHRAVVRSAWVQAYGEQGQLATSEALQPGGPFLRQLCYFADPGDPGDVLRLAAACALVLASKSPRDGRGAAGLELCAPSARGGEARAAAVQHVQRLVALCLVTLARQAAGLAAQLAAPRQGAAAAAAGGNAAAALLEVPIALAGADAWKPFVPAAEAAGLAAQVMAHLVRRGLFQQLAVIIATACPEASAAGSAGAAAAVQRTTVPAGEALATALVVRYMALQGQVAVRLSQPSPTAPKPRSPLEVSLAALLCVPLLVSRCPSLRPVAGRLWHLSLAALRRAEPAQLVAFLPEGLGLGKSGAAAALMGNLLENAAAALKAEPSQLASMRPAAVQLVGVLSTLLQLLPLHPFFQQPPGWAEDEEDATRLAYLGISPAPAGQQLAWDEEQLPPAGIASQMQLISDANFLRAIVSPILPQSSAATPPAAPATNSPTLGTSSGPGPGGSAGTAAATAAPGPGSQQTGQQLQQQGATVRALCALLYRILQVPGQRQRALIVLAVRVELTQRLWFSYLKEAHAGRGEGWAPSNDDSCDPGWMLPLTVFSLAYSSYIITAGDDEVYDRQRPLPLAELYSPEQPRGVLSLLKFALWNALWLETAPTPGGWSEEAAGLRQALKEAAGKLMGQLYDRNCRRAFAPASAFQAEGLPPDRFHAEMQAGAAVGRALTDMGSTRAWGLLTYAPYLVPFHERAKVFQAVVSQERNRHRDMDVSHGFALGGQEPSRFVTIRRNQLLQDGFERLSQLGEGLRGRVRVQFISEHGLEEAGVDGGGIFKEFLEEVVREGFNPDLGLFLPTTDQRLYPNPHVRQVMPGQGLRLVEFLGKVLGKAMYEGILVELPLAGFFLKKFRGMYCDIGDLPTLDLQLYKSLMFLKRYEGDVSELGLTFTVSDSVLGETQEVELVPNGHDRAVTNDNVVAYIHRVADFKLNQQIREPTAAFLRGLHTLIRPEWVLMFNEEELQMLISGGQQGLDIEDMKAHVQYSGGYHEEHPVIQDFWRALATLSPEEQGDFLRFVTSCPRPPLLGFRYLEPPLCIQMAGSVLDPRAVERLPTAATCMNLLKLPPYTSAMLIRNKLLYAIKAGAGFELS